MINVLIIAVILLVVALCIRSLVNDRKAGRSSCGGNCASCGACCHGTDSDGIYFLRLDGRSDDHA